MKIKYKGINFRAESLRLIELINTVVDEYSDLGYDLTLRQVYYQLVARGIIPNNERSYKNTGNLINDARLAGLIDWYAIQDRTRHIRINSHWDNPKDIISSCVQSYAIDTRSTQPNYIEVWVEKDALIGIVQDISRKLDVPCFSCRGYVSASEMWVAARRFINEDTRDRRLILHLGDHDPSGKDMSRDIEDRLGLFGANVEVHRIALNFDQVEEYSPPPNPTKLTDSRASGYIAQHGYECWELDALEPLTMTALIRDRVESLTDIGEVSRLQKIQDEQKGELRLAKTHWNDAINYLKEWFI